MLSNYCICKLLADWRW